MSLDKKKEGEIIQMVFIKTIGEVYYDTFSVTK